MCTGDEKKNTMRMVNSNYETYLKKKAIGVIMKITEAF
jgi:hypothetical protein